MQRIRLTATEQAHLEHIFKTTTDRRLRDRCQAVLMASRGRKRRTIAQDLGVHRTTVRRWLTLYHERGWAGLQIHWAPGQPGRMPETLAPTIQGWVQDGPQSCGLERANWTYEARSSARQGGTSVSAMTCAPLGRRIAICGEIPRSSRRLE